MSQTLLMFSLMLQPLLIQYVSNGCDKIAVTTICFELTHDFAPQQEDVKNEFNWHC